VYTDIMVCAVTLRAIAEDPRQEHILGHVFAGDPMHRMIV
jgi:hypothetical protein